MTQHEPALGVWFSPATLVSSFVLPILLLLVFAGQCQPAGAQQTAVSPAVVSGPLSTEQVVKNVVSMNLERFAALHGYRVTEGYHLEYHGFLGTRSADMVLDATYQSPGTVKFAMHSATGSRAIINKVFKILLQAEQQVLGADAKKQAALNQNNYEFTLAGYHSTPAGSAYVLRVEPRRKDRFLYRGRIWVDAKDFAVVRIEAEPAKSLSFWVRSTEFRRVYRKVSDFWLPASNHSISQIRFGGSAKLTIRYSNYVITSQDAVTNVPVTDSARTANSMGAQPTKPEAKAHSTKE
jgi:outer membrane lipoprotein-sorting protein